MSAFGPMGNPSDFIPDDPLANEALRRALWPLSSTPGPDPAKANRQLLDDMGEFEWVQAEIARVEQRDRQELRILAESGGVEAEGARQVLRILAKSESDDIDPGVERMTAWGVISDVQVILRQADAAAFEVLDRLCPAPEVGPSPKARHDQADVATLDNGPDKPRIGKAPHRDNPDGKQPGEAGEAIARQQQQPTEADEAERALIRDREQQPGVSALSESDGIYLVGGKKKKLRTAEQRRVVERLVKLGRPGLTLRDLRKIRYTARNTLRWLSQDEDWRPFIHFPGRRGGGFYGIW